MNANDTALLEQFEEKLIILSRRYMQERERNKELLSTLRQREDSLNELQRMYDTLLQSHNNLKQARVISLSDAEISVTRERLSGLVREIDRCIESLTKQ